MHRSPRHTHSGPNTDRNGLWGTGFNFGTDRTVRSATGLVNITPPAQPERGIAVSPVLASNIFNGHVYIAFQERFGAATGNDTDIYFARSTDSGVSWALVSVESSTGTDFYPMMAVDRQSNAIGIAYYTTDGDQTTGNDDVRMRLALSSDFGNTWSKGNIGANTSNEAGGYTGDYLEYTGLALRDGTAHVLWASRYPLPVPPGGNSTELDAFTARVSFDSSTNNNILRVGSSGPVNNNFIIRRSAENANYLEFFTDGVRDYTGLAASIDSITFESNGGIDSYAFDNLPAIPISILGSTGADTFNINSLSGASLLTISSGNGDDVVRLGGGSINVAAIASPVVFNGGDGNDTLYLGSPGSGNADSVVANVTFNGEGTPGGLGNRVIYNDQEAQYQVSYNIGPSAVTRQGFVSPRTVTHSNTSRIIVNGGSDGDVFTVGSGISPIVELYGNDGSDNFVVGGGLMDAGVGPIIGSFNGGNGTDQITYDDHLRATGVIWDIHPTAVYYGGIFQLNTTGFEAVGVLAGNGADQIYSYGDIGGKIINIDAGGGDDLIDTNHSRALTLNITGGAGNDTLEIDDVGIPTGTIFQYVVFANQVYRYDFIAQYDVFYGTVEQVKVILPAQTNNVYIASTTAVAWAGTAIYGNTSSDTVVVNARDGAGNATIQGPVYALTGDGADVVEVDATASSTPIDYAVGLDFFGFNPVLTGFGNAVTVQNSETIRLRAGGGNDTFALNASPPFAPPALEVLGGDGDDTVNIAQSSGNLANVKMPLFNYNGGKGYDSMYVYNGSTTTAFGYYLGSGPNPSAFSAWDGGSHVWEFRQANTESLHAYAGSNNDIFQIFSTSVSLVEFSGQGGNDLYDFGIFQNLQPLQGRIKINGSGGSDTLKIENGNDTTGRTYHITQNTISATQGDNLLGPGGSVEFIALAGAIIINNGSSSDTVFAQPNATAAITINGANPTTTPGDALDLNFADGESPMFTTGAPGAGGYTFSDRQPLNYTGFESAVAAYPGDFNRNGTVGPSDYDLWKAAFGTSVVPATGSDGNGNGMIDAADYIVWRKNYGKSSPGTGGVADGGVAATAETLVASRPTDRAPITVGDSSAFVATSRVLRAKTSEHPGAPSAGSEHETAQDRALLAWFAQPADLPTLESAFGGSEAGHATNTDELHMDAWEPALVELAAVGRLATWRN